MAPTWAGPGLFTICFSLLFFRTTYILIYLNPHLSLYALLLTGYFLVGAFRRKTQTIVVTFF